jgi:endonuclease-3
LSRSPQITATGGFPIDAVMPALGAAVRDWPAPFVSQCALDGASPFKILVATILSLRTRDQPTKAATEALFALAGTPAAMARLPLETIAEAIKPALYFSQKAQTIQALSARLAAEFGGRVPDDIETLVDFKGVGRKTANLVVTLAFNKPGICVDTHVHRITNRWGYVQTMTPGETEQVLRRQLPGRWWPVINDWLVRFGQGQCRPASPHCSACPLARWCTHIGVTRSR